MTASAVTVAAACAPAPDPGPATFLGMADTFGATIPTTGEDEPFTFGSLSVCTPSDVPLVLDEVRVDGPSELVVRGFAVRERTGVLFGSEAVPLADAGFDPSARTVSARCAEGEADELAVELARPAGAGTVTAEGFRVVSGEHETFLPFVVTLCAPDDDVTPDC